MDEAAILDRYVAEITRDPQGWQRYQSNARWTSLATAALVETGIAAFPLGERAAKEHPDRYGRSEYLTLDVCICDPNTWAPPLFVAEHENHPRKTKVQYCAWKLVSTLSSVRMLVAYFGEGTDMPDFAALRTAVTDVLGARDDRLLLVGAEYLMVPSSVENLRIGHKVAICRSDAR